MTLTTLINRNDETPQFGYHLAEILKVHIVKQIPKKGPRPFWFLLQVTLLVHRADQELTVVRDLSGELVYEMLTHLGETPCSTFRERIRHCQGKPCIVCLDHQNEVRAIFSADEFSTS